MVHCVNTPRVSKELRQVLVPIGPGVLVGAVSRRVFDALLEKISRAISSHGGHVVVAAQSSAPQGFTVWTFGHTSVVDIDGISVGLLRTFTGN